MLVSDIKMDYALYIEKYSKVFLWNAWSIFNDDALKKVNTI